MSEQTWTDGNRAAWTRMLGICLGELGHESPDAARLIIHLEGTRAALRRICAEFGDNDWSDDLHLADVIEKHLERHLQAGQD